MSDSRWYTNRIKFYEDGERDRSQTPTQKRFKKQRASRHNRRSMKQHLIVHAHVIPAHGRVINQTGKTAKIGRVPAPLQISTVRWQAMLTLAAMEQ